MALDIDGRNGILVSPLAGSGDTTLEVKAKVANRGNRVAQIAEFTVSANGVEAQKFVATHVAAPEFVSFDESSITVDKDGQEVTITGKSNSATLTFAISGNGGIFSADRSVETPENPSIDNYSANGVVTVNGSAIEGDPGAEAQYAFSITLTATNNPDMVEKVNQIDVTAAGGQTAQLVVNQTASEPNLEVIPTAISVPQDGSAVSVQVKTNTSFTVA